MSEMIERVAKAMADSEGDLMLGEWAGAVTQRIWTTRAELAIAAMREPSGAMIRAVQGKNLGEEWAAMIAAALKE